MVASIWQNVTIFIKVLGNFYGKSSIWRIFRPTMANSYDIREIFFVEIDPILRNNLTIWPPYLFPIEFPTYHPHSTKILPWRERFFSRIILSLGRVASKHSPPMLRTIQLQIVKSSDLRNCDSNLFWIVRSNIGRSIEHKTLKVPFHFGPRDGLSVSLPTMTHIQLLFHRHL